MITKIIELPFKLIFKILHFGIKLFLRILRTITRVISKILSKILRELLIFLGLSDDVAMLLAAPFIKIYKLFVKRPQ